MQELSNFVAPSVIECESTWDIIFAGNFWKKGDSLQATPRIKSLFLLAKKIPQIDFAATGVIQMAMLAALSPANT